MFKVKGTHNRSEFLKIIYERRYVCRCGHVIYFSHRTEKLVCKCCGKLVYRDNKAEFKDKLLKAIEKKRIEEEICKKNF